MCLILADCCRLFNILVHDNQTAMESLTREREARLEIERSQNSLSDELGRVQRELSSANQKVK